ncbi:hypothetical protein CEP51_016513, partial [Fusarium floridanum]
MKSAARWTILMADAPGTELEEDQGHPTRLSQIPRHPRAPITINHVKSRSELRLTRSDSEQQPIRVRPGEVAHAWDDIQRQRAEERDRRAQAVARRNTVTVPEDELRRTMAAITQRHAEERLRERTARLRPQQDTGQVDRRGAEEVCRTQPPATPERISSSPQVSIPQAIPQTPQTRKRPREPQPGGLLTPPPTRPGRPRKRPRSSQETALLQRESLETILRYHVSRFRDKERESAARSWCKEVPLALQVETAQSFDQAFTDERTLPISHCDFCYRKQPPSELTKIRWRRHLTPSLLQATAALQECRGCFSAADDAEAMVCHECYAALKKGKLPKTCAVNNIYRKHVKGHIVVFPNKVEDLVATVLPHPLLVTIENIHVSWSGSSEPGAADVGHLLQVRKSRVRAALSWLQENNPLYEHVTTDHGEIDGWRYADGSDIPILIMDSMQREEPSVAEKTQTDHIVPDTDRGLEENRFTTIEEIVASAQAHSSDDSSLPEGTLPNEQGPPLPGDPRPSIPGPEDADGDGDVILETTSSGMFPLDGPAAFEEADKLSFLADALPTSRTRGTDEAEPCAMHVQGTGGHPFILVERGADFADSLHKDFFPRTFPKLFPWGRGGPKALHVSDREQQQAPEAADRHSNHSLSYWARYVLQRHGGRFATHPVFCFLVFNILLRSYNRRISM